MTHPEDAFAPTAPAELLELQATQARRAAGVVTRADVVAEARTWLGTPWQHQARLKGVGVDCAGLLIGVARALGLVPRSMDVSDYARRPDGVSLLRHCNAWMDMIPFDQAHPGDVIAIRFDVDPQHIAILTDYPHGGLAMIHALDRPGHQGGHVIEHRLGHLRDCVVATFRLRGVVGWTGACA